MTFRLAAIVALAGSPALAVVVPPAYTATTGTGTFTGQLGTTARTYQYLIHSSQLTGLVGQTLTGLAHRLPSSATANWPTADINFANYDIYLSASVDPALRSLTFANNIVGTQTQVRSGPLTVTANSYTFGGTPTNAFGPVITFNTPYLYTGGNLLVELRHSGFTGTSRSVDAILTATAGYGVDFSACWTGSYTGVTGTQATFAILDLVTGTPPPSCYANCDQSTTPPILNVGDFSCFLNAFASGESYANCDGSTTAPVLNVGDFSCFLNAFAAGCS